MLLTLDVNVVVFSVLLWVLYCAFVFVFEPNEHSYSL